MRSKLDSNEMQFWSIEQYNLRDHLNLIFLYLKMIEPIWKFFIMITHKPG